MYYQQQTTTTTATKWNGNAWVQSTNAPNSNPYSSHGTQSQVAPPTTFSSVSGGNASTPAFPTNNQQNTVLTFQQQQQAIQQYTDYHKHWLAQCKEQRAKANSIQPGTEKDELIRHAAWAEHYATLSTQAIQYYKSLSVGGSGVSAVSTTKQLQQPFGNAAAVGVVQSQSLSVSSQEPKHAAAKKQQSPKAPKKQASKEPVAGFASLKHFNQRALSQCKTEQEKEQMQKQVNKVISAAKKRKTLFSTDWANFPIPVLDNSKDKVYNFQSDPSLSSYSQQQIKSSKSRSKGDRKRFSASSSFYDDYPPLKRANNDISQVSYLGDEEKPDLLGGSDYIPFKVGSTKKSASKKESKKKSTLGSTSGFVKSSNALKHRASRFSNNLGTEVSSSLDKFGQYMGTSVIGGSQRVFDEADYGKFFFKHAEYHI